MESLELSTNSKLQNPMLTDFVAVLVVILFAIIAFFSAMKNGVAKLLASGCAAAIALAILFAGLNFLPEIAKEFMDSELSMKSTVGISVGAAILAYFFALIVFSYVFKALFGADGWFHWAVDGFPGAILSLFPSMVVAVFVFTCVRVAGTLQELNYAASLSQENIDDLTRRIPPYPLSANWRNGIEDVPLLAPALDRLDPFSNRVNRNAAALVIMHGSGKLRSYLLSQPEAGDIAAEDDFIALRRELDIRKALDKQDRIGLVMDPTLRETAAEEKHAEELRSLDLKPILVGFGKTIQPDEPVITPAAEPGF